jgi:hypothetical protein
MRTEGHPRRRLALLATGLALLAGATQAQSLDARPTPRLPSPDTVLQGATDSGSAALPPRDGRYGGNPPPDFGAHAGPQPLVSPPLPSVPGALPWDLLAQVRSVAVGRKVLPQFPDSVSRLHRTPVKVVGFMLPLQPGERQSHFLLTATSQTCAFCVPVGPEGIIEVRTRKPVRAGFDAVLIAGRLEVLQDDPQGVYYRIRDGEALPVR